MPSAGNCSRNLRLPICSRRIGAAFGIAAYDASQLRASRRQIFSEFTNQQHLDTDPSRKFAVLSVSPALP